MRFPIAVLVAGVVGAGAWAQENQQPPTFVSEVKVNNITVDVQVRDSNGVPVAGLGREQFRLLENGQEQVITNFLAVEGGVVRSAPDERLLGEPAPRTTVLFFDLYLLAEPDKRRVLERMREQVAGGLPPGQTVAVVSFDGALRVHTEPTASGSKLLAALKEVDRLAATGLQRQITLSSYNVSDLPSREVWSTYQYRQTQNAEYWEEMRRMVSRVENAFTATVQRFAGVKGRKIVVLISPGFPRAENVPMYREWDFWLDKPPEYRNAGLYGRAALLASELEFTLYTLDPSGNQSLDAVAAASRAPEFNDVANIRFWREADRKDSLIQAAKLTGGDAIFTVDGGVALADVERVTSSYYSLAYQPDHYGDGKDYTIKVEVKDHPDWQLTHRQRYIDRPFEVRDAERSRAALLTGFAENPLGIELVLSKPTSRLSLGARGMRIYRTEAELRIPYAELTLIPRGNGYWGQVQVVIVGVDPRGDQSELAQRTLPIEVSAEKLPEARKRGYFAFKFTLELDGGPTSLRVAVNDTLAQTTSTVVANLDY
jgi:VWFA-related protein